MPNKEVFLSSTIHSLTVHGCKLWDDDGDDLRDDKFGTPLEELYLVDGDVSIPALIGIMAARAVLKKFYFLPAHIAGHQLSLLHFW